MAAGLEEKEAAMAAAWTPSLGTSGGVGGQLAPADGEVLGPGGADGGVEQERDVKHFALQQEPGCLLDLRARAAMLRKKKRFQRGESRQIKCSAHKL